MNTIGMWRRATRAFAAGLVLVCAATALVTAPAPASAQDRPQSTKPSGTISIRQGQAGFIVTAGYGGGTLQFRGKSYRFKLGNLGIGGMGAAVLEASGSVYDLKSIDDFPGAYVAVRTGIAVGDLSTGKIWLRNEHGVYIRMAAKRQGLMLSAGADGVIINMD